MGAKGSKAAAPAYPAGYPGAAAPAAAPYGAVGAPYGAAAAPYGAAPFAAPYGAYGAYPPVGGLYDTVAPPSYSAYAPAGSFGPSAVIPPTVLQQQVPVAPLAPVAAPIAAPVQYQTVSPAFFQGLHNAYPYAASNQGTFTVPPSPAATYSAFGGAPYGGAAFAGAPAAFAGAPAAFGGAPFGSIF